MYINALLNMDYTGRFDISKKKVTERSCALVLGGFWVTFRKRKNLYASAACAVFHQQKTLKTFSDKSV